MSHHTVFGYNLDFWEGGFLSIGVRVFTHSIGVFTRRGWLGLAPINGSRGAIFFL